MEKYRTFFKALIVKHRHIVLFELSYHRSPVSLSKEPLQCKGTLSTKERVGSSGNVTITSFSGLRMVLEKVLPRFFCGQLSA